MVHWGFVYKEKGTLCRYKHLVVVEAKLVGGWGWLGQQLGGRKKKKKLSKLTAINVSISITLQKSPTGQPYGGDTLSFV